MDSLEEMLYFKHNQISSHVKNYMNLTSIQTDNYISLLGNSSLMLEKAYNETNKKILIDYKILKEIIKSQIKEIKKSSKKEEIDNDEKLFDFFKNEDLYQPIGFIISNKTNNLNNSTTKINYSKSNTIKYYQIIFEYYKNKIFNNTDEIYFEINNIFEESNKYQINKRRIEEKNPSGNINNGGNNNGNNNGGNNVNNGGNNNGNNNGGNNNGNKENKNKVDENIGVVLEFSKNSVKYEIEYCLEKDFSEPINKILKKFNIPIFPPIELRLSATISLGFCAGLEFELSLKDDSDSIGKIYSFDLDEDNEQNEDEDSKLELKVVGKGEVSLSVKVGVFGEPPLIISFFAGIKGLLGRGEIGCSMELNLNKLSVTVDSFYKIEAFFIYFFLKIEIEFKILVYNFKIEFYIFNQPLFGIKFEHHNIIKKALAKLIYKGFNPYNYLNMRELNYE